jgi:hypothetical protein
MVALARGAADDAAAGDDSVAASPVKRQRASSLTVAAAGRLTPWKQWLATLADTASGVGDSPAAPPPSPQLRRTALQLLSLVSGHTTFKSFVASVGHLTLQVRPPATPCDVNQSFCCAVYVHTQT